MEIKSFSMDYWNDFVAFINQYWAKNHPITNIKLFKWQYQGFGPNKGITNSKVLYVDGMFSGFRGVIPGLYQYYKNGEKIIAPGKSFAMWMVHPELRGKGYGIKLLNEAQKDANVFVSTGINVNTAVPIYLKNNYNYLSKLNRYVTPIEPEGYLKLLKSPVDRNLLKEWIINNNDISYEIEKPKPFDSAALEKVWIESTKNKNFFGLYRNKEFWKWRYLDSPFYKYILFGDIYRGFIIARMETISGSINKVNGKKVIRLIEIIPVNGEVWEGKNLKEMSKLIRGVINWAKFEECSVADFQISTNCLESLLINAGFKLQTNEDELTNVAGIFSPYRQNPTPINALWKIVDLDREVYSNPNDTYIVKSDNDMDRPIQLEF